LRDRSSTLEAEHDGFRGPLHCLLLREHFQQHLREGGLKFWLPMKEIKGKNRFRQFHSRVKSMIYNYRSSALFADT